MFSYDEATTHCLVEILPRTATTNHVRFSTLSAAVLLSDVVVPLNRMAAFPFTVVVVGRLLAVVCVNVLGLAEPDLDAHALTLPLTSVTVEASAASSQNANPLMLFGLNPVARGLSSLGLIAMA